jgi:hypothetical protein
MMESRNYEWETQCYLLFCLAAIFSLSLVSKWFGWGCANIYTSRFQVKWTGNIGCCQAGSTPDLFSKVSKFGHAQETNYSDWSFLSTFPVLQKKLLKHYFKIGHNRFPPHLIPFHWSILLPFELMNCVIMTVPLNDQENSRKRERIPNVSRFGWL